MAALAKFIKTPDAAGGHPKHFRSTAAFGLVFLRRSARIRHHILQSCKSRLDVPVLSLCAQRPRQCRSIPSLSPLFQTNGYGSEVGGESSYGTSYRGIQF